MSAFFAAAATAFFGAGTVTFAGVSYNQKTNRSLRKEYQLADRTTQIDIAYFSRIILGQHIISTIKYKPIAETPRKTI